MSKSDTINSSDRAAPFPFARYEGKCDKCVSPLKIILGIIILLGIALAAAAPSGPLRSAYVVLGASTSVVSLVALVVLFKLQRNGFKEALHDAKTFAELKEITDTSQISGLCSWTNCVGATNDVIITSSKLRGSITASELQAKINSLLRDDLSDEERGVLKTIIETVNNPAGIGKNAQLSVTDKYLK